RLSYLPSYDLCPLSSPPRRSSDLGAFPQLGLVTLDVCEHHGFAAVPGTQVGQARVPVRDDGGEPFLLLEVRDQGPAALLRGRIVDAAAVRADQQDQVRLPAELLVDGLRRPGGLGGGVVEAA